MTEKGDIVLFDGSFVDLVLDFKSNNLVLLQSLCDVPVSSDGTPVWMSGCNCELITDIFRGEI